MPLLRHLEVLLLKGDSATALKRVQQYLGPPPPIEQRYALIDNEMRQRLEEVRVAAIEALRTYDEVERAKARVVEALKKVAKSQHGGALAIARIMGLPRQHAYAFVQGKRGIGPARLRKIVAVTEPREDAGEEEVTF